MCVCSPLVCVVPSRCRRLSCGGGVFTSSALDELSEWLAMVSQLRRGVLGSWARSEPKECWQMRSRLMGGRSRENKMADADVAAELQGLQAGEEGAAMPRRQEIAAWRPCGSKLLPCVLQWDQTRLMPWSMLSSKGSRKVEQFRSRCQEEMREEEMVKRNKNTQQVALPTPGGFIQGAPASSLELDLLLVRVYLAKAEVQEDQEHQGIAREAHQDLQDGTPWMKERMTIWKDWCLTQKRKNSQGKDPKTFEGNSQGRDPSTQERNSLGEDPRTLEESSKGGNVSTRQTHSRRKDPRTFEAPVKKVAGSEKVERKEVEGKEEEKEEK